MNYIKEVVKLLGLELGEKFELEEICGTFYFKEDNLYQCNSDGDSVARYSIFIRIINGAFTIKKIPFKPKYDEKYYYVYYNAYNKEWHMECCKWYNFMEDLNRYALGNCYRTQEDVEKFFEEIKSTFKQYIVEE